ncbi:MAG: glycosyl hydrolase, partial [Paracoccaceae bacterium]
MNIPKFSAEIIGNQIHCSVTSATLLIDPIFCFSLMAPPAVESGGILIREDGGYGEVQLPELKAGLPHEFILYYADPTYKPRNRAWLPLGAYLRCGGDIIELPKLPAGVTTHAPVPCAQVNDLCLVPKPHSWAPSGGFLAIRSVKQKFPLWKSVDALALRCNLSPLQE